MSSCFSGSSPPSNVERFLQCVTPFVPSHTLPQSCLSDLNSLWQPHGNKDSIEYFTLKDLWDCYYEWSAYGASAPVMLESGDTVIQYYVPYLSPSKSTPTSLSRPLGLEERTAKELSSKAIRGAMIAAAITYLDP
ncbi:hypothetical protein HN51_071468 [Arachis hypogaea]